MYATASQTAMARSLSQTEQAMASDAADPWADSQHAWLMKQSSRRRGKSGEMIIHKWLEGLGMKVDKAVASSSDRTVNGHRVEVKLSTLWTSGQLTWQQLRDQDYSHVLLLGIEPQRVRVWCIPKDVIRAHATPQHTGQAGTETLWLSVRADAIPSWMDPYGGDLDLAAAVAAQVLAAPDATANAIYDAQAGATDSI
jgi:hypothetical protein